MSMQTRTDRALGLIEKTILGFIAGAAAAIGIVEAAMLVGRVIRLASDERTTVTGVPVADAAAPGLLDAVPQLASARYESLALAIDGLPPAARGYLIASAALTSILAIGICAAVAWLCLRVFVGRPFVTSATWGIGAVAILVIVAGIGSSVLTSVAHSDIIAFLGLTEEQGFLPFSVTIDLAPLGWGLALAVVAGAFELGQRMQRETDGLV